MRLVITHPPDALFGRSRLADTDHVVFGVYQGLYPGVDHPVVVDKKNSKLWHRGQTVAVGIVVEDVSEFVSRPAARPDRGGCWSGG